MDRLWAHFRNKLFAGGLAAVPIVVLVIGAVWLEENTRPLTTPLGFHFPGLGVLLALVGVYLLGLIVTSLLGRFLFSFVDKALRRVPGLRLLYQGVKDIWVTPPGKTGVFDKVVLVPDVEGRGFQLGFTSGETVPGDVPLFCVFLPSSPNPLAGRLVLAEQSACPQLTMSVEEAFKFLLSGGNYVPGAISERSASAPQP